MTATILRFRGPESSIRTKQKMRIDPLRFALPGAGALCGLSFALGLSLLVGAHLWLLGLPIFLVLLASIFLAD